jgi:hypothetical protein
METQLEILRQTGNYLDERSQIIQIRVLEILTSKLEATEAQLKGLVQSRSSNLLSNMGALTISKWSGSKDSMLKGHLDKAVDEMESWRRVAFDPLYFTLMKAQSQQIDELLNRTKQKNDIHENKMIAEAMAVRDPLRKMRSSHFFLSPDKLDSAETKEIALTQVRLIQIDGKWRLLDLVSNLPKATVRELGTKLKSTNPSTFGLLTCLGAVHHEKDNEFDLIFRIPEKMSGPETLRARMSAGTSYHSLSDRFRLAAQLALAVHSIHTFDMVHKSIRPENIILFRDQESALGSAFLVGFERVRREEDNTKLMEDADWEKNLYRHPQRQGAKIRDRYIMQHDIYSLGVCLLEIGLWSSFVEYDSPNDEPRRSPNYDFSDGEPNSVGRSEFVKACLVSLATDKLPATMGTKYSKVVESCLTCLDVGNEDFGDESEIQEDGIVVAVRYIEKVRCPPLYSSANVSRFSCS